MNFFLKNDIVKLRNILDKKEISFLDLAQEAINTIKQTESETHAWTIYDEKSLLDQAKILDNQQQENPNKALLGIPFGIKDIFNTKAFKTEMGSPIWKDFNPGNNARVVDSLIDHGALVVGKTVTAEFAVHALNETVNPHDISKTPGTSSSGSAAAVARGMVPFALGTQTAGSIIRPVSFCGVWGMKPSFGMIPRTGVLKTTDSLDSIGFLAAHGKSLRPILDAIRVKGPNYPFVYKNVDQAGAYPKPINRNWKVGFVKTHIWDTAEQYAKDEVIKLINQIAGLNGFDLEELEWPESLREAHEIHPIIYTKSLAYYFNQEVKHSNEISEVMNDMIAQGENISIELYQKSLRKQDKLINDLDNLLESYDFVVSLGTSSSAPLRGKEEIPDPSLIWTLCHVPSVGIPAFRCPAGLPFGVQFISRRWNDYGLLQAIETLVNLDVIPSGSQPINQ